MPKDKKTATSKSAPAKKPEEEVSNDALQALREIPRPSWWSRLSDRFNALLEERRGYLQGNAGLPEFEAQAPMTSDNLAIKRNRNAKPVRLVIPADVTIAGHLMGSSDTEVSGHIDGNLAVEGRLYLGASGRITGDVRASACRIEGRVDGNVDCAEDLDLTKTGCLGAKVHADKRISLAGQVYGNVSTSGSLKLASTAIVMGDVQAQALVMEDGAILNGVCRMRNAAQRSENET